MADLEEIIKYSPCGSQMEKKNQPICSAQIEGGTMFFNVLLLMLDDV